MSAVIRHLSKGFPLILRLLALCLLVSSFPTLADINHFPMPKSLEPAVDFWTRVYTEVEDTGGFIHDNTEMGVVYGKIHFPAKSSRKSQQKLIKAELQRWRSALKSLASGKRGKYPAQEKTIQAAWGRSVKASTLRAAAGRVRFQRGQANRFRGGVIRSGAYVQYIEDVFRKHGLPAELGVTLPHVESSFTVTAHSHAGAAGLWQFTRSTGRRFMRIDHVVDERLDPFRATHSAARLLGHNHSVLKHWPLAITAYNHGLAGMRRAVRSTGSTDIGVIVRQYKGRLFGFASRNFYAAFLAARRVSGNPEAYFGKLKRHTPSQAPQVKVPSYLAVDDLSQALGISKTRLKQLNPALRASVWRGEKYIPKQYNLRLPPGSSISKANASLTRVASLKGHSAQKRDRFYRVRRGDTLGRIAKRYGTSVRTLMNLNSLRSKNRIRIGQQLRLPGGIGPATTRTASVAQASQAPAPVSKPQQIARASDGRYQVRRGDTLDTIAARFGTNSKLLASINGIRNRNRIRIGQTLKIPSPDSATVVAKLDTPAKKLDVPPLAVAPAAPARAAEAAPAVVKPETATPPPDPAETAKAEVLQVALAEPADKTAPDSTLDTSEDPAGPVEAQPALSADPADYRIDRDNRIEVQAAETLGHYAEWLKVRAQDLRRLNGLRYGKALGIGKRIKLDLRHVNAADFEQQRLAFHQDLQSAYFETHRITGTKAHKLRRGDSLWSLAVKRFGIPLWLLRQYNPDMDLDSVLPPGGEVQIPTIALIETAG